METLLETFGGQNDILESWFSFVLLLEKDRLTFLPTRLGRCTLSTPEGLQEGLNLLADAPGARLTYEAGTHTVLEDGILVCTKPARLMYQRQNSRIVLSSAYNQNDVTFRGAIEVMFAPRGTSVDGPDAVRFTQLYDLYGKVARTRLAVPKTLDSYEPAEDINEDVVPAAVDLLLKQVMDEQGFCSLLQAFETVLSAQYRPGDEKPQNLLRLNKLLGSPTMQMYLKVVGV